MYRFGELYDNKKSMMESPWLGKMRPFRIVGNVYFIGTFQASTHLIDTGDGLIVIDPGYNDSFYLVINSIYELGFSPKDIKYIVNTHWHGDHTEATAAFTGENKFIDGKLWGGFLDFCAERLCLLETVGN